MVYRGVNRQTPPPETPEDPKKPKKPEDPEKPKTPETPETPENPDIPKTPEDSEKPKTPATPLKNQKAFPNTGQEQTNLLLELGLAGLALGAAVYLRRSKNGRYTFLVVTILGTTVLGSHLVVADGYKSLINQVTQIVQDDAEISNIFTPTTIPNYKYVGYIRRQRPVTPTPDKKGTVNVHYRDKNGNMIAPMAKAVTDGKVGSPYSTKSLFRQTIEKDGKNYKWVETRGVEEGKLSEGVTNVTYIYELETPAQPPVAKKGSVVVKYTNTAGQEIKASETVLTDQPVGTAYDVTDKKEDTLTGPDGKTYHYKSTTGNPTGSVVEGITEVTYVYEENTTPPPVIPPVVKKGSVVVKYVNESGQELKSSETVMSEEPVGTAYDVTGKKEATLTGTDGKVYRYKSTTGNPTGSVVEGTTEVTYVYEEATEPVKEGSVIVRHIAYIYGEGEKEILPQETVLPDGPTGREYDASSYRRNSIISNGKAYAYDRVEGNVTGRSGKGVTYINFIYRKVSAVTVRYISQKTGRELAPSVVIAPAQNGAYSTLAYKKSPSEFSTGLANPSTYQTVRVDGHENGAIDRGDVTVTYYYDYDETPRPENQGSYAVDYTFALTLHSAVPLGYGFLSSFNSMTASYKGQPMMIEALGDYYASYALISGRVFTGEGKNGEEIKNAPTLEEIIQNIDIVFEGQTFHGIEAFKNHIKNIRSRWISIDKDSEVYQTNASTYTPATRYLNDKIVQLYQTYDYEIKTLYGPGSR